MKNVETYLNLYVAMLARSPQGRYPLGGLLSADHPTSSGWLLSHAHARNSLARINPAIKFYEDDELVVASLHFAIHHIRKFEEKRIIYCPLLDAGHKVANSVSKPVHQRKGDWGEWSLQGYEFSDYSSLVSAFNSSHEAAREIADRISYTIRMNFPLGNGANILAADLLRGTNVQPKRKKATSDHRDTLFRAISNGIQVKTGLPLAANATALEQGCNKPHCASVFAICALFSFKIIVDVKRAGKLAHGKKDSESDELYSRLLSDLGQKWLSPDGESQLYAAREHLKAALEFLATPI